MHFLFLNKSVEISADRGHRHGKSLSCWIGNNAFLPNWKRERERNFETIYWLSHKLCSKFILITQLRPSLFFTGCIIFMFNFETKSYFSGRSFYKVQWPKEFQLTDLTSVLIKHKTECTLMSNPVTGRS